LSHSRLRVFAVLALLGLVLAACGGTRSDEAASPSTSSDVVEDGPAGGFGDLASPCGPAEGENVATGDQGVTADSITIGYGDDAGYQGSPGLNKPMSDAVRALIDWCNDQGGINGRTLEGEYYDGKVLEATNVMTEACAEVFMLVGHGFVLDGAAEQTRVSCGLPQVPGYTVSATVAHGPMTFNSVPNPIDLAPTGQADLLAKAFPEQVKKAAVVYGDVAAMKESAAKVKDTYPDFGWTFLPDCEQTYAIGGTVQWGPYVQKLKDCGAEVVYFSGAPMPNLQNFLDAASQADYRPKWVTDTNFYEETFAQANTGGNADEVYVRMVFTPFEQAESNEATKLYLDLVEGAGGQPATLGVQATSSFLLWATAAKACGADLTRQCVLDELAKVTSWTGGGLHAETNPAQNRPGDCSMVLKIEGTEFVQALPETEGEFACDPRYVDPVSPTLPALVEAQLGPDRVSRAFAS
jgi:ABC-type branched-subunit amino acid transport system substrate-binding protein